MSDPWEEEIVPDRIAVSMAIRGILSISLKHECEACRPRPQDVICLHAGHRVQVQSRSPSVRFVLAESARRVLNHGTSGRLEVAGEAPRWARVEAVKGDAVTFATHLPLSGDLSAARFTEDPRWLTESLKGALRRGIGDTNDAIPLEMLGLDDARGRRTVSQTSVPIPIHLNPEQAKVVHESVRPGVLWLHGPPGTGKTWTLAATIRAAVAGRRRVLAVAPSNGAVDALLTATCGLLREDPGLVPGLVVRYGHFADSSVQQQWGPRVDPWAIARKRLGVPDHTLTDAVIQAHRQVVTNASVILTTTAQTHLARELPGPWDLVILDEAGMTPIPAAYHLASLVARGGTLLLAGDHRQLPTVTRSRHPFVQRWCAPCPFTARALCVDRGFIPSGARVVGLETQYRMDAAISDLVSDLMYNGRLTPDESVLRRAPLGPPFPGNHLVLVDSSTYETGSSLDVCASYADPAHARLAAIIARRCASDRTTGETLVLSRFRDQVGLIRRNLRGCESARVSTVHSAQGCESDTVIVDLSMPDRMGWRPDFLRDEPPGGVGARLLNTALSRARRRLILIANVPSLVNDTGIPQGALSRQVLEHILAEGMVITAAEAVGEA